VSNASVSASFSSGAQGPRAEERLEHDRAEADPELSPSPASVRATAPEGTPRDLRVRVAKGLGREGIAFCVTISTARSVRRLAHGWRGRRRA
jgi:hypothetical protein